MAYSFGGRGRYSEIGQNGLLTLPAILNYFQDCTIFHSEDIGLGVGVLEEKKRCWVLSAWQVIVNRYPNLSEKIKISTWPYGFRGFMGMRNFTMDSEKGERLAYANTYWSFINSETGLPEKLTESDISGYKNEKKLDMEYAPRKITLPSCFETAEPFSVQKHHLDTNHHVNNTQYIQMAMDYVPEGFCIRQMRAEYKQQARLNDVIIPQKSIEQDKVTVLLNNEQSDPYAVVEFLKV